MLCNGLGHWLLDADEHDRSANVTCLHGVTMQRCGHALCRITFYTDSYGAYGHWRRAAEGAPEQHFTYDDVHRVTEVRFDGDRKYSRTEYRYDALGRRTHKILHRHHKPEETISFLWSGLRVVR